MYTHTRARIRRLTRSKGKRVDGCIFGIQTTNVVSRRFLVLLFRSDKLLQFYTLRRDTTFQVFALLTWIHVIFNRDCFQREKKIVPRSKRNFCIMRAFNREMRANRNSCSHGSGKILSRVIYFLLTPDQWITNKRIEKRISYMFAPRTDLIFARNRSRTISIVCLNSGNLTCLFSRDCTYKIRDFDSAFLGNAEYFFPARARVRDIMISRWKPFLGIVFIFARAITRN